MDNCRLENTLYQGDDRLWSVLHSQGTHEPEVKSTCSNQAACPLTLAMSLYKAQCIHPSVTSFSHGPVFSLLSHLELA